MENWLLEAVREEPVVILTGARQVGKSTLLKHALPQWTYHNLDDFDTFARVQDDPSSILTQSPVIIDEAQREPRLFQAIKQAVDKSRRQCRVILSGSANLLLLKNVTESLAGRAVVCELGPFTWGESFNRGPLQTLDALFKGKTPQKAALKGTLSDETILTGFMPIVMLERKGATAWRWLEGYVTSYLERDLRQLSQIEALADFRRLMQALAARTGQLINQTEIGRDISLKQPTVYRYINILEASLLAERLPAYAMSKTKRLIKAPKAFFMDSGLSAFLAGMTERNGNEKLWGSLFETAVLQHLHAWCQLMTPKARAYYWRTATGAEVDFIVERGRELIAIEVKSSTKPTYRDTKSLKLFLDEYPSARGAAIVYPGSEIEELGKRIYAIPFSQLV